MLNDENWRPWEQKDLQYRPVRSAHYRPPRSSTPYSFFSSSSHQPSTSIYVSFHPYAVPTRSIPPYLRPPSFFNTEFTSPRISYQRNTHSSLNRSDSWISRPAPLQLTNEDSCVNRGFPSKSSDIHQAFPLNSSDNFRAFPTTSTDIYLDHIRHNYIIFLELASKII